MQKIDLSFFNLQNIYIYVSNYYYKKIQKELDQIIVLISLLDTAYKSYTLNNLIFKTLDIYINDLVLTLIININTNKLIFIKLRRRTFSLEPDTIIYLSNDNTNLYTMFLDSLIYIKKAL